MSHLTLFGNLRSPYVRRVRVVALELALDVASVDTDGEPGASRLRELTPLWKMPVAHVGQDIVFDSGRICQELLRRFGPGPIAPLEDDDLFALNVLTVIDGALEALINVAYLARDGVDHQQVPYLQKQRARAVSALSWLNHRAPIWAQTRPSFGFVDVALITTLDVLQARHAYPIHNHPELVAWAELHRKRPSICATAVNSSASPRT